MNYLEEAKFIYPDANGVERTLVVDNINVIIDPRLRYVNIVYDILNAETGEKVHPNIIHAVRPKLPELILSSSVMDMVVTARSHANSIALKHPVKNGEPGLLPLTTGVEYEYQSLEWVEEFLSGEDAESYGFIRAISYVIRTNDLVASVEKTVTYAEVAGADLYFCVERHLAPRVYTHFLGRPTVDRIVSMASGWDNAEGEEYRANKPPVEPTEEVEEVEDEELTLDEDTEAEELPLEEDTEVEVSDEEEKE